MTAFYLGDVFGRSGCYDFAAAVATFRADINNPVGGFDNFEIVLDDSYRIACVDQFVQHFQQFGDIVKMQARSRFIQNIERAAGRALRQFLGQLDALRFATRKRGGLLPDLDISQPDALQSQHFITHHRHGLKKFGGFVDRHVQNIGNAFVFEAHFKRFAVIALAVATVALDIDIRQKVHFDFNDPVALAGFAAPAFHVE